MPPLEYPPSWKFDPPAIGMQTEAHFAFLALVRRIASGQSSYLVYQTFKEHFGQSSSSSDASWAEEDMAGAMVSALADAVGYVASFLSAIDELHERQVPVPEPSVLNRILRDNAVPLLIEPPQLRLSDADAVVVSAESAPTGTTTARSDRLVRGVQIGEGGFGTVYKATRTTSVAMFEYALKLLNPSPFIEDQSEAAARFARERKILQRLQHRAIVPYFETGMVDANHAYILMPLIEGSTLRGVHVSVKQVCWTFDEVLGGLEYLHGQKVIHRDLKPSNIMIRSSDRQPLLLDFGCAYLFEDVSERTLTTAYVGSAAYVPPELHASPTLRDAKQDVYACGIMLYEVLRGHRPDPSDYAPLTVMADAFAPFDTLIQDAIAPFSKRLSTAREFRDRLAALAPAVGDE